MSFQQMVVRVKCAWLSTPGSPNYGPRAKPGPRTQSQFVNNEKNIYSRNICWFDRNI